MVISYNVILFMELYIYVRYKNIYLTYTYRSYMYIKYICDNTYVHNIHM